MNVMSLPPLISILEKTLPMLGQVGKIMIVLFLPALNLRLFRF